MATSTPNRVISYFFLFDFYHLKGSSDELDLVPESIIYFYPLKEDIKRQKLLDCGEIVGLMQCLKFDLFSCVPKEFIYKKSLVTSEHYGRHSAFLVLSKDRFTTDEANIHLTHILQLFNMLYGSLNRIQSVYSDINQIQTYLKQTLTPIVEYVFNENRSIRNLFSAIDYAPVKKNTQRCLLHVKHFLYHLQSTYEIKNGFFAYEKRILYSTFDVDTTYYIQVILDLERHLSKDGIYIPPGSEVRLKNGVSLRRIYMRRPLSLQPILNAVNANTNFHPNRSTTSHPINISDSLFSNALEPSPLNFGSQSLGYSVSISNNRHYSSVIQEDPAGSSEEATGFETDRAEDTSPPSKTETDSIASSVNDKKLNSTLSKIESISIVSRNSKIESTSTISRNSKVESLTDDQKTIYQYARPHSGTLSTGFDESVKPDQGLSGSYDRPDRVVFEPMQHDDDDDSCDECRPENVICLPPVALGTTFRARQRTITSYSDMIDTAYNNSSNDHHEGHGKWGDTPEKNDEAERDELILYVQRNSRMIFAGIIEKNQLSEEYLQNLWCLILTGMADMDRDIQVVPISGETSKHNTDIKFQFNDNSHQVQYEQFMDINHYYYKIPSSDSACMAFTARTKMNQNPERKMIGLSRGSNLISLNRSLPDRVTYFCRRFQDQH